VKDEKKIIRCMGNPKCAKDCGECAKLPRTRYDANGIPDGAIEEAEAKSWENYKMYVTPCAGFLPIVTIKQKYIRGGVIGSRT
jgi:hypothetical protein